MHKKHWTELNISIINISRKLKRTSLIFSKIPLLKTLELTSYFLMLLNYGVREDSLESHGLQGDQTSQS